MHGLDRIDALRMTSDIRFPLTDLVDAVPARRGHIPPGDTVPREAGTYPTRGYRPRPAGT